MVAASLFGVYRYGLTFPQFISCSNRFDSTLASPVLFNDDESTLPSVLLTMSLLRACQQAVSKQALGRVALTSPRPYTTGTVPTADKHDSQIADSDPPHRDVVTADIVSGAPSESRAFSSLPSTSDFI